LRDKRSNITHVILTRASHENKLKKGERLTLALSFKIDGNIREVFNPKFWETAYDKHDNVFRMSISIALKVERTKIFLTNLIRKAPMFWTRSPKIPFRIWVSIIRDNTPFYPVTIEEAKSLLFDVNKMIEVDINSLNRGKHRIFAEVEVTWGRHNYTEPGEITNVSKIIDLHIED
jgi:hypothetical protein